MKSISKQRLDHLLVARGLAPTRSRAAALILAGQVLVAGQPVTKAGTLVAAEAAITLSAPDHPYVGRGGLKLAAALEHFQVLVTDRVCLDAGASTGGFTDCLLQHGAARVYAVDVGRGQLAWRLQQDPRVVVMDQTNLRTLAAQQIPDPVTLVTLDLAFISLTKVLPVVDCLLQRPGAVLALIKPQFEVGRGQVGKGGIVRDPAAREAAVSKVMAAALSLHWTSQGCMPSPITGADGNHEFVAYFVVG